MVAPLSPYKEDDMYYNNNAASVTAASNGYAVPITALAPAGYYHAGYEQDAYYSAPQATAAPVFTHPYMTETTTNAANVYRTASHGHQPPPQQQPPCTQADYGQVSAAYYQHYQDPCYYIPHLTGPRDVPHTKD